LPLLIELRDYAISQSNNFLNFLHHGRGVDWQFDQQQLHQHLLEFPTLVMFDGLDEVFDRATQSAIIDDIIRFAQQYPNAQILITSRIIGYNPDRLQQAKFRHFTIQPLDTDEIHEFIDRWYTLALGNDSDKPRLVTRLKDAIANSTAIQNLADNPLLLTMMAILNRRQELPRDRADLYEQASRVLLYHWDVDHKRLQLPVDAIGRREKQEMLRAIAYEMQAGEDGLKGNLISSDRLTRIITDYLRDQGYSESREKAHLLIQKLRDRNFILCYRGADTYGFMHRTFLEYFCATEIVHRFENQRTLTFEQLRDEVFGKHWHDETWHEVLKLICGAIDPKFAGELIGFLMTEKCKQTEFLENYLGGVFLQNPRLANLLIASKCLQEIKNRNGIEHSAMKLFQALRNELKNELNTQLSLTGAETICEAVAQNFYHLSETLPLFWQCVYQGKNKNINLAAAFMIAKYFNNSQSSPYLYKLIKQPTEYFEENLEFLKIAWEGKTFKEISDFTGIGEYHLKMNAVSVWRLLSLMLNRRVFKSNFRFLIEHNYPILESLITQHPDYSKALEQLRDRATNDPDEQLREWAQEQLKMQNGKLKEEEA